VLAASTSCAPGPSDAGAVGAEAEVIRTTQALTAGSVTAINGAYGAGCSSRAGFWSVLVSGTDPLPNPVLSVVRNNGACSLTLTSIVAGSTYTGTPAIAMTTDYGGAASAFASSGPVSFYANAKLDSTSFASTFVVTLLVSSDPAISSAGVTSTRQGLTGPSLGAAETFAVLAGTTVTSTGATAITGDLGVSSPGVSVTGFPPATIAGGAIHVGDPLANQAQADVLPAYDTLAGETCGTDSSGQDLGGRTLSPGVYCFAAAATLTGQLVLDAQNDADAVFIFQIGSTFTTAADSSVVMSNGGQARNVFWQIGSSATLGTNTALVGNLLAFASITFTTGVALTGRALVRSAVTMDTNAVSVPP
jgi:hypothetical protein